LPIAVRQPAATLCAVGGDVERTLGPLAAAALEASLIVATLVTVVAGGLGNVLLDDAADSSAISFWITAIGRMLGRAGCPVFRLADAAF